MNVSLCIHLHGDENINVKLNRCDEDGHEYYTINFAHDAAIFGSEEDMRKLCETLHKSLYDDPTYEELENENIRLEMQMDELKESNGYLKQLRAERMGIR